SVDLVSVGTAPSGATRSLALKYDVYYILKVLSNAAVNTTGRVLSPDGLVTGNPATPAPPSPFTVSCRSTCQPTGTSPVTYTLGVRAGPLPDVGDVVTLASQMATDLAFKVRHVDSMAHTVDLAALDATNTALQDGASLTQTVRGAALLVSDAGSLPAGGQDCQTYACGQLDVAADQLFRETFGIGKQTFSGEIGAHYPTDACSGVVRWIDLPESAAPTLTLSDCPTPRIVVVRAPALADAPGGTPVDITVNLAPGSVFHGLLYVIGTHDLSASSAAEHLPTGPGSNVTLSATDGSFMGSVLSENAVTDALNASRTTTLNAVTTAPPAANRCATVSGAPTAPTFCYDRGILGSLLAGLNAALPESAKPRVAVARYSWAENGN
ncbi:hypothetical protein, partial [Deinococcus sp.]|uniref:hypothetical protein n=1 Tax=Deinococcus sp. TaxID=47478 RepID=UPI002869B7CF